MVLSFAFAVIVFTTMALEAVLSRRRERILRSKGAVEAPHDVFAAMLVAYPSCFVAMIAEGWFSHGWQRLGATGVIVFVAAKMLKYWAIAALGERWSFRVFVLPGVPLVTTGPYTYLRHPNYLAVVGEMIGVALAFRAPVSGIIGVLGFSALMRRRIMIEEQMLGLRAKGHRK